MNISLRPVRNVLFLTGFFIAFYSVVGCSEQPKNLSLTGITMGTSYSVKISEKVPLNQAAILKQDIDQRLQQINQVFSTYQKNSEVSQFNLHDSTAWQAVSAEFLNLLQIANAISEQTSGLYDVTVGPLVNLWGFGPTFTTDNIPSDAEINSSLKRVGYQKLVIDKDKLQLKKTRAEVYLDFSSIAKGYGVDQIAELLEAQGYSDYMVEIGGELRVKGHNEHATPWVIAVERPDATQRSIQLLLELSGVALATSGDYRNFFEQDGVRYSHTINARTGKPVKQALVSVTVIAQNATEADAWATALLALGQEKGYELADKNNLSVLFINKQQGDFIESMTPEFKQYIKELL